MHSCEGWLTCYTYTYDTIFITRFLKSNMKYIQPQGQPPPQWKIVVVHLIFVIWLKFLFFTSFFLSFLVWPLLTMHYRCWGLLLYLITLNDKLTHTHTHTTHTLTHTYTHSVGFLWTSDRPVAEASTWQHTTLKTNIHARGGIRNRNRIKSAAADLRLRQRERLFQFSHQKIQITASSCYKIKFARL